MSTIIRKKVAQGDSLNYASTKTLGLILAAARILLSDPSVGRDCFTTSMIADKAGVSIGTVYRYFPNRLAILKKVWPNRRDSILQIDNREQLIEYVDTNLVSKE